jgi:hypothetical protein
MLSNANRGFLLLLLLLLLLDVTRSLLLFSLDLHFLNEEITDI